MYKSILMLGVVALMLSACGKDDAAQIQTNTSTNTTTESGENFNTEIDESLKQMQAKLPIKAGDALEITSIERSGKDINYTFTILNEKLTAQMLGLDQNKAILLQQLCQDKETQRFWPPATKCIFIMRFPNQTTSL